jgi:type VI secretion system protein ImpI
MNALSTPRRIALVVANPEILQHGSAPARTFDSAGGTIGCRGAHWILLDSQNGISPIHCEILMVDGAFCLIDRCGLTRMNHGKASMGPGRVARLNDGDLVHVGLYQLAVHMNDQGHMLHDHSRHLAQHQVGELLHEDDAYLDSLQGAPMQLTEASRDIQIVPDDYRHLTTPLGQREELDPLQALDAALRKAQLQKLVQGPMDTTHYGLSPHQPTQADLTATRYEAVTGSPVSRQGESAMPQLPYISSPSDDSWQTAYQSAGEDTRHIAAIPLLQGLEVPLGSLDSEAAHYLLLEAGKALKAAVQGIAALYGSPTVGAQRLTMLSRTLQPIEDNPLRLGQSYEDTVRALFSSERSVVHLSPQAAIHESLAQARHHNAAVIQAIGESLDALLRAFSPDVLLQRFNRYAAQRNQAGQTEGWSWQMYTHYYNELVSSRQQGFEKLFWEVFEQAYDRAIRMEEASV